MSDIIASANAAIEAALGETRWTPEQELIFQAAPEKESLMIDALAGTGKTTTLVELSRRLPAVPSLALAFNVRIKKELEKRLAKSFTVSTMNGLGHSAWARAINKRMGVEEKKLGNCINEVAKDWGWQLSSDKWTFFLSCIKDARNSGVVPSTYTLPADRSMRDDAPETWADIADDNDGSLSGEEVDFCRAVLHLCIKKSFQGIIDYDDQIYMSALFGGVFPRYPLVMVDEGQDLSPLNHKQVKLTSAGRLVICGDPRQAIYAFRGADSNSMGKLRRLREHWIDLPLSTTFRCPKLIVARQHAHVPSYNAAPSNGEGAVHRFDGRWTWESIAAVAPSLDSSVAIISRNNAPVISAAFRFLRHRKAVTVLGRDIGKGLISLSKKILPDNETEREICEAVICQWRDKEIGLARANEKEHKVSLIEDKAESLLACFEAGGADTAGDLRRLLHELFESSSSRIILSTGHKAKGLEWDIVLHLDPWRIPSKYARAAAERGNDVALNQDLNLRYVVETRAKHTLILANLEDMYKEEE